MIRKKLLVLPKESPQSLNYNFYWCGELRFFFQDISDFAISFKEDFLVGPVALKHIDYRETFFLTRKGQAKKQKQK